MKGRPILIDTEDGPMSLRELALPIPYSVRGGEMRNVKWSIRDDGNSTWAKHSHGDYVVTVTDMDGDGTEWEVWLLAELENARRERQKGNESCYVYPIAKGYVSGRAGDDFAVGQAVAIEALDAIISETQESPEAA